MTVVRSLSLRDPRAFAILDQSGRCGLHLVAQYSENVELLQSILQVDCKMTKVAYCDEVEGDEITPLGLLCRRSVFPTLDKMVACLIEVDISVEVIKDGILQRLWSCDGYCSPDSSKFRGETRLILFRNLLDANSARTEDFYPTCFDL
jgi:hypothetical protein